MITLSTLPVPEIDLSMTLRVIEKMKSCSSVSRMIRTYRLIGACVCQRHWLDLTWLDLTWPSTFWPQNLISAVHPCAYLHWSCKFGEICASGLQAIVLTNFEYIITPLSGHAWTHEQSPSAFKQCQRHKNTTRNVWLERLSDSTERVNWVSGWKWFL